MKKFLKRIIYFFLFFSGLLNIICASQAYHLTHFYGAAMREPEEMGNLRKIVAILFGQSSYKATIVDSLSVPHTAVAITTDDGLKLAAWHLQHTRTDSLPARGTIIMFHGHADSRNGIIYEATSLYKLGWNILMVDFRAHGESEGNKTSVGYHEAKDVKAAYDKIIAVGEKNVVLWGISMGAAAITKTIHDYPSVKPSKIILEIPFGTMLDGVEGKLRTMNVPTEPFGVLSTFWGGTELGMWAFSYKPEEYAKSITCPVLLQWGKRDIRVTENETNDIYKNVRSSQKELVVYNNVTHESICKYDHAKWMQNVTTFLNP